MMLLHFSIFLICCPNYVPETVGCHYSIYAEKGKTKTMRRPYYQLIVIEYYFFKVSWDPYSPNTLLDD